MVHVTSIFNKEGNHFLEALFYCVVEWGLLKSVKASVALDSSILAEQLAHSECNIFVLNLAGKEHRILMESLLIRNEVGDVDSVDHACNSLNLSALNAVEQLLS